MKFQYFTYFLNQVTFQPLFLDERDKNEILKEIITNKIEFQSGTANLIYLCPMEYDNFIFAKIGKKSSIKRNLQSENDFIQEVEDDYPNCQIFFNLSNDPDKGQRIAFEYKSQVFRSPEKQLKALEDFINSQLLHKGYVISIHPIVDKSEFWSIVQKYKGKIEKLTFSYSVPNLFNLQNSLSVDLKSVGSKYCGTKISAVIENKDGQLEIPKDDPFILQSAEYTGRGGGEYKFKIKNVKSEISSGKNVKTISFDELELIGHDSDKMKQIINEIFNK
jgi:hypothetical protein